MHKDMFVLMITNMTGIYKNLHVKQPLGLNVLNFLIFFFSKTINYIGAGHFIGGQMGIEILQFILCGLTQVSVTSNFTF